MKGWLLLAGGLGIWALIGDPKVDVANFFWKEGPAPWEKVDAFYYPNRNRLSVSERRMDLDNLDACRAWVQSRANANDDRQIRRGDYECAMGFMRFYGDLRVYRLSVK